MDAPLVVLQAIPLRRTLARADRLAREASLGHLGELEQVGCVELRRGVEPGGDLRVASGGIGRAPVVAVPIDVDLGSCRDRAAFRPAAEEGFVLVRPSLSAREPAFRTPANPRSPSVFHADSGCAKSTVRLLWSLT